MSRGALLIARNNSQVDYVKQAIFCAEKIQQHLNIPVTLLTDNVSYMEKNYSDKIQVFDNIIALPNEKAKSYKKYRDGVFQEYKLEWKNTSRNVAYDLTPYNETLLMDTDYILANNVLINCFEQNSDLMMYNMATDLAGWRDFSEFSHISPNGIDFYWATIVFFRKTKVNKIFFDLVGHIKDNWYHYKVVYKIMNPTFRNDFAFSIAAHIMNGYMRNNFVTPLPGKKYVSLDNDICIGIDNNKFNFLVQKEASADYFPVSTKEQNVHIMNKFSLNRIIDES